MSQTETIHTFVDRFTRNLRLLANALVKAYPKDETVARARKRIGTGIDVDPLTVVNMVGVYLFKYKDQIYAFNPSVEAFFMESNFDDEIKAGVDSEKVDLVKYLIPRVKDHARTLPPDQKKVYIDIVVELLDDYIETLTIDK